MGGRPQELREDNPVHTGNGEPHTWYLTFPSDTPFYTAGNTGGLRTRVRKPQLHVAYLLFALVTSLAYGRASVTLNMWNAYWALCLGLN